MIVLLIICQLAFPDLMQEIPISTISDGPYLFLQEEGTIKSITIVENELEISTISLTDGIAEIPTSIPSVPIILISQALNKIPLATVAMPDKLLAVSDIEGNLDQLLQFLQVHSVIDSEYNWNWKNNHLLFNGDSVDRGEQVTELLWFIRKLQQQATDAGGQVHFVLGNHDVMILADDIRYTHPKYKIVVEKSGIPYHQLFADMTVLGQWLRNQNSAVQIGAYLFVHAGYSPELNRLNLSLNEINTNIRKTIGPPAWPDRDVLATSLAWHSKGPLWYRGYFDAHAEKYGPKPTDVELDAILKRHQAKAVVVGHTITGNVGWLDGDKRLIGIDVHWDTPGEGQGLLVTKGKLFRATMTESNEELVNIPTAE